MSLTLVESYAAEWVRKHAPHMRGVRVVADKERLLLEWHGLRVIERWNDWRDFPSCSTQAASAVFRLLEQDALTRPTD